MAIKLHSFELGIWDRKTDGQTGGRTAALFNASYRMVGHNYHVQRTCVETLIAP